MSVFMSLAVSLLLTLALESGFALLWGVKRRDMILVLLANLLTNPAVVWGYTAAKVLISGFLIPVTVLLEAGAVMVEGRLYRTRSGIRSPRMFALCANAFSFAAGLLFYRG